MTDRKILQIIPADGWWVVVENGHDPPTRMRIACWAIVEQDNGSTEVVGLYVGEDFVDSVEAIEEGFKYEYLPTVS